MSTRCPGPLCRKEISNIPFCVVILNGALLESSLIIKVSWIHYHQFVQPSFFLKDIWKTKKMKKLLEGTDFSFRFVLKRNIP